CPSILRVGELAALLQYSAIWKMIVNCSVNDFGPSVNQVARVVATDVVVRSGGSAVAHILILGRHLKVLEKPIRGPSLEKQVVRAIGIGRVAHQIKWPEMPIEQRAGSGSIDKTHAVIAGNRQGIAMLVGQTHIRKPIPAIAVIFGTGCGHLLGV